LIQALGKTAFGELAGETPRPCDCDVHTVHAGGGQGCRKGQVRQVTKAETTHKKPGPMQRYTAAGSRVKKIKRSIKATQIRT
jgi:hypothetical protein